MTHYENESNAVLNESQLEEDSFRVSQTHGETANHYGEFTVYTYEDGMVFLGFTVHGVEQFLDFDTKAEAVEYGKNLKNSGISSSMS